MACSPSGLVQGSNVVLQIYKAGQFRDFAVATNISIDFNSDVKSIKTIGDGVWKRQRQQAIGYSIKLDGLIKLNTGDDPGSFDVLGYMTNFVDIVYRITFEGDEGGLKVVTGQAIVNTTSFMSGPDGFATSSFTLLGNGEPEITETFVTCDLSIDSVTTGTANTTTHTIPVTMNISGSGTLARVEYSVNGQARQTSTSTTFNVAYPYVLGTPDFVYVFYPICTNGFEGSSATITLAYSGGTGPV